MTLNDTRNIDLGKIGNEKYHMGRLVDQGVAAARAFCRITCGGYPKMRRKARRTRLLSPKPVSLATVFIECRPCAIMSFAASTRRLIAGDDVLLPNVLTISR